MKNKWVSDKWELIKDSFKGFSDNKVPKLAASLAYYTVFSLGPLLIVIIFIASIFLGREAIEGTIYTQIEGFVGADAAKQIEDIIKNASVSGKGITAATIGVVTLIIGATSVFGELQDSINSVWGLKAKPKQGFLKLIKNRLLSFGIIGTLGFLLLVSLGVTAVVEGLSNRLKSFFPDVTIVIFYVINLVLTLGITTILFGVIFKVLPDSKMKWKEVWPGAIATSLLFLLGKFGISLYISKSAIGDTYGAAGSLVILLVWVYYSAIILYFGAVFTKVYVVRYGNGIVPNHHAEIENETPADKSKAREKQKQDSDAGAQIRPA